MEQENRIMFAQCYNLKRKRRIYVKSKVPASPDSSDEEEAPENQIGSINNLKRKRRSYVKSKVPASPDSSDDNTSANVVYRLGNITHSGIRGRFASRIKDQNDSYITITVTLVLLVLVIVTGIYLTWFCKLRSPTYSRVDPGKSQSRILHVVHCQRPNKYIKENKV